MEPRKTETITVRVTSVFKKSLQAEAKRDNRKLGAFCEILLRLGEDEYYDRKIRGRKRPEPPASKPSNSQEAA
jgi:hypothetical protein